MGWLIVLIGLGFLVYSAVKLIQGVGFLEFLGILFVLIGVPIIFCNLFGYQGLILWILGLILLFIILSQQETEVSGNSSTGSETVKTNSIKDKVTYLLLQLLPEKETPNPGKLPASKLIPTITEADREIPQYDSAYFPDEKNDKIRSFYKYWLRNWKRGKAIDVGSNQGYIEEYLSEIKDLYRRERFRKCINELKKIRKVYSDHISTKLRHRIDWWIADSYITAGEPEKAFEEIKFVYPQLPAQGVKSQDYYWGLKVKLDLPVKGEDIIRSDKLTPYGKANYDAVCTQLTEVLREYEEKNQISLLNQLIEARKKWAPCVEPYSYSKSTHLDPDIDFSFYKVDRSELENLINSGLMQEAENRVRTENNVPKIGEGWISEATLKDLIIKLTKPLGYKVKHRASPDWLGRQHIDIYIPELNLGIEYMGRQHYQPIKYFGGVKSLKSRIKKDEEKVKKCKEEGVTLIRFKYDEPFEPIYVAKRICEKTDLHLDELETDIEINKAKRQSYLDYKVAGKLSQSSSEPKANKRKELSKTDIQHKLEQTDNTFKKAEILRKAGFVKKAERKYWEAIKENEQRAISSRDYWESLKKKGYVTGSGPKISGPIATPYIQLAKLYYHTGYEDKALDVLDRYIENDPDNGEGLYKNADGNTLRDRMSNGDFPQLKGKYDTKPTGKFPS